MLRIFLAEFYLVLFLSFCDTLCLKLSPNTVMMHQPQAGERAGTSRGHHVKIVLESPGARLCRTMITQGGGRNDNEENGSDSTPHWERAGITHTHFRHEIIDCRHEFLLQAKKNMDLFPAHRPGKFFFHHQPAAKLDIFFLFCRCLLCCSYSI